MGTQKLKAAVISAGMIANSGHIPAYKAFSQDVSLEAVCDLNASAARDTALRHDIPRWYSDVAAMLEEVHPDLVSVCTPNSTHKGLVAQALKAGANVICEKPLTLHYADTVGLYALAEKLGKQLVVCQTSRFQRAYFAARDYIADGVLGNIYYAEIDRIRRRGVPSWGTFHRKAASGGHRHPCAGRDALDAGISAGLSGQRLYQRPDHPFRAGRYLRPERKRRIQRRTYRAQIRSGGMRRRGVRLRKPPHGCGHQPEFQGGVGSQSFRPKQHDDPR